MILDASLCIAPKLLYKTVYILSYFFHILLSEWVNVWVSLKIAVQPSAFMFRREHSYSLVIKSMRRWFITNWLEYTWKVVLVCSINQIINKSFLEKEKKMILSGQSKMLCNKNRLTMYTTSLSSGMKGKIQTDEKKLASFMLWVFPWLFSSFISSTN